MSYQSMLTAQAFVQHNASWAQTVPKSNNSMLERARERQKKMRRSEEGEAACQTKYKPNLLCFL